MTGITGAGVDDVSAGKDGRTYTDTGDNDVVGYED